MIVSTVMAYGNQPHARPLDALGPVLPSATAVGLAWLNDRPATSTRRRGRGPAASW
ncbi:hypothetical protein AB0B45_09485 [Nonomuraea sp. NPDC049152]|uniref:hypothetical protein n=1 Tax=Nonomuraea sp. NPDC049152 TaxID=3154350 RepID=UPI0033F42577